MAKFVNISDCLSVVYKNVKTFVENFQNVTICIKLLLFFNMVNHIIVDIY